VSDSIPPYPALAAIPTANGVREVAPGAIPRIRTRLATLAAAEQRAARFFVEEPGEAVRLPVKQLAARIGVSDATVVRASQALGFAGLRDLKLALAAEVATPLTAIHEAIGPDDSPTSVLRKVLSADSQAVLDALATLEPDAFTRSVEALDRASRIECYGVGSSLPICLDAAYRLLRIGLPAFCFPDPHMQAVAAGQLPPGAVAFVVSHTGRTTETLATVTKAKGTGATILLLTSHTETPLGELADVELVCAARETAFRTEAMASRIAHLSVVDALYVAVAVRRFDDAYAAMERANATIAEHRLP
jgi:DNA-binding MurR/RpiR family transcriptional regulator